MRSTLKTSLTVCALSIWFGLIVSLAAQDSQFEDSSKARPFASQGFSTGVHAIDASGNLVANGGFDGGLAHWSTWVQRGRLSPTVSSGQLHLAGSDHNGGVYQQITTGGPGTVISIDGFWVSDPTVANSQWAEVLIINSDRVPVDGQDVSGGDSDVETIYKNDTWASSNGWSGAMDQTARVINQRSFTASADHATLVLKSGSVGGKGSGTRFDDLVVQVEGGPPPANHPPTALAASDTTAGPVPLSVQFDGAGSSDPDGDDLTYEWDFGDGAFAPGAVVSHTYTSAGSHSAVLTVRDGRGGSDTDALQISASNDGDAQIAYVKVGFHAGLGGNRNGIGDYFARLDAAGIPFSFKSVADVGAAVEAARYIRSSGVPHNVILRFTNPGGAINDVPDFSLAPEQAAQEHWDRVLQSIPLEFEPYKDIIWIEPTNELDTHTRADWIGWFCYHIGRIAMSQGYRVALAGFNAGQPEPHHWELPGFRFFLEDCARYPDHLAVSLHEGKLGDMRDHPSAFYPHLIGRFTWLYEVTDRLGIERPTTFISEWAWSYNNMPSLNQAMEDVAWLSELVARYPSLRGVFLWNLGGGSQWGELANKLQKLISPLTDYALAARFEFPPDANQPPVAEAVAAPTAGEAPLTVSFDGTGSLDSDGDALSYFWDFGDGSQRTGPSVTHTYGSAGLYDAILSVDDGRNGVATAVVTITVDDPIAANNLITNGVFEDSLNGWSVWRERGSLEPSTANGRLHITSSNHNGGVYQQFSTGGAGTVISVDGFWETGPTVADNQWAEVLVIDGDRVPVDGQDITAAQSDVVVIYKNDTWARREGWSGSMEETSAVVNQRTFIASGALATVILKSGNVGGATTGMQYDDLFVGVVPTEADNQP